MWRFLHVVAIGALIASAAYVYSVKYQTIYASEQIVKTRHLIAKERDAINLLRAEYAHLIRPDRLQALADKSAGHATARAQSDRQGGRPARTRGEGRFDRPQARVAGPSWAIGDAERRHHRRDAIPEVGHVRTVRQTPKSPSTLPRASAPGALGAGESRIGRLRGGPRSLFDPARQERRPHSTDRLW